LEKNGERSSSKRTRAINISYFFVTDQIEKATFKSNIVQQNSCLEILYKAAKGQTIIYEYFRDLILGKVSVSPTDIDDRRQYRWIIGQGAKYL
jgi:hypothetical protein